MATDANNEARGAVQLRHPSETRLKPKYREISFVHHSFFSNPIVLKFCTEHGSDTAVLLQSDRTTETDVTAERDFARFEFKMSFERVSYIAQHPRNIIMILMLI